MLISYSFTIPNPLSSLNNSTHYCHFCKLISLNLHPSSSYYYLCISHFSSTFHLSFQTTIKITFKKITDQVTISSSSPFLMNSNCSYMKVKLFYNSYLERYFCREAFLHSQTRSMSFSIPSQVPMRLNSLMSLFDFFVSPTKPGMSNL